MDHLDIRPARPRGVAALAAACVAVVLAAAACSGGGGASTQPTASPEPSGATATPAGTVLAGTGAPSETPPELTVAVSTPILADIVANVAGERAEVFSVILRGADPHNFELGPQDVVRVAEADLFIYMGAHLEAFMESTSWRRSARESPVPTLEYASVLDLIEVGRVIDHGDHTHDLESGDPHAWLDPLMGVEIVEATVARLSEVDSEGAAQYRTQGDAYAAELHSIHEEYEAVVARIPEDQRRLIVLHDAYRYLEQRYGLEVIGFVMGATGGEPSAGEVADLHRVVESAGVDVVFTEPQVNAPVLDALARDRGVEVGLLLTDTLIPEADSYLGLLRFNLRSLETHLAQ